VLLKSSLTSGLSKQRLTLTQRCTTSRRLYFHKDISEELTNRLIKGYKTVRTWICCTSLLTFSKITIGDPLDEKTLVGPVHNKAAVDLFRKTIEAAKAQGGQVVVGGNVLDRPGNFVEPTLIRIGSGASVLENEAFVPISYIVEYSDLDSAIRENNKVSQGLSSSLFTRNVRSSPSMNPSLR
jgi:acyl-CoA reductase-like NAD-dependent aldehyde dehydrogenase